MPTSQLQNLPSTPMAPQPGRQVYTVVWRPFEILCSGLAVVFAGVVPGLVIGAKLALVLSLVGLIFGWLVGWPASDIALLLVFGFPLMTVGFATVVAAGYLLARLFSA